MKKYRNIIIAIIKKFTKYFIFLRKKEIVRSDIDHILINSLYFVGDTMFHTPIFEAIKVLFPNSRMDIWVKSRNYEVVKNNKCFDKIIVFNEIKTADYNEKNKFNLLKKFKFIKLLRNNKYDLYIDLTGKYSTAILALLCGFKYSAGINYHGFGFCLNKYCDIDTSYSPGHVISKYLSLIKSIFSLDDQEWSNIQNIVREKPYLYIDRESVEMVNKEFKTRNIGNDKPIICIHTTAGWKAKEMSSEKYVDLIKLILTCEKYYLVIIESLNGVNKLNEIQSFIGNRINLLNFNISLNLNPTFEIIRRSDLFIGPDSAPLHAAGAFGTSSIGLFGPTNPEFYNPEGTHHLVVYNKLYCSALKNHPFCSRNAGKSCPTLDCMQLLNAIDIFNLAEFLLKNIKSGAS